MARLVLEGVSKHYDGTVAVERVDLEVEQGELVALLGPSGCGKTTTLRVVAGFVPPSAGRVLIGGRDVTRLPPHARDTGMVFQSYALFPHMTVAANVAFGLEMRRVARAERDRRVAEVLRLVRLEGLAERLPRQLSGGQQQRVALARALVVSPAVFLLDEPLSNLDAKLRGEVGMEIRALQKRLGLTTLMVTHDQDEALAMADRLLVMEGGRMRQLGTAEELYERPANLFVAGFVGRCNLLPGRVEAPGLFRLRNGAAVPCTACGPGESVLGEGVLGEGVLMVRPERVEVRPCREGEAGEGVPATLSGVTYLGALTEYRIDLGGLPLLATAAPPLPGEARRRLAAGDPVRVWWPGDAGRLLPPEPNGAIA